MAKKVREIIEPDNAPLWPTGMKGRTHDDRLVGTDNSVWLIRGIPMAPQIDAKTERARLEAGAPIYAAFEELALMARNRMSRRNASKSTYREFQLLTINTPQYFEAPRDHEIADKLNTWYANQVVQKRVCGFAVKLKDSVGDGTIRGAYDSIAMTLSNEGTPMSDYDRDAEMVSAALARAGLERLSKPEVSLLDSWWNHGLYADTPFLAHSDHLHVFQSAEAMATVEKIDKKDCSKWPQDMPGEFAITFAAVESLDIDPTSRQTIVDPAAAWISQLISANALAVSVRGLVEPSRITRAELRRNRQQRLADIRERARSGNMERFEEEDHYARVAMTEKAYSTSDAPPTLVDVSAVVALSGHRKDMSRVTGKSITKLVSMNSRQPRAMAETWLCSKFRANPYLQDWPATLMSASGINGLSKVGDKSGMLIGFTENDRQPAFLSPVAASNQDSLPLALCAGATGSGKTQLLLWLAHQAAEMGRPNIIIDPKALALDTRIPTPNGWTTMRDIQVGDTVFSSYGLTCTVTHKSRVFTPEETHLYEFEFEDGQVVTADQNHMWVILDEQSGRREMLTSDILAEGWQDKHVPVTLVTVQPHGHENDSTYYEVGVEAAKQGGGRVPTSFQRGSQRQRYALIQGFMDTCGEIDGRELVLAVNDPTDILSVIRSLGMKARCDGGAIRFTSQHRVFLHSDKTNAQPLNTPGENTYNKIVDIRQVESAEAQCIRVDSIDHTYLVEDFVVTHNTGSDHSDAVLASGGQVASLDELVEADGIFDPLRFAHSPRAALDIASSLLQSINPWGRSQLDFETPLSRALSIGIENGAKCIGQALQMARGDDQVPDKLIDDVLSLANSSASFAACVGMNPESKPLSAASGTTLIKVGNAHLDLPSPGSPPKSINQRVSLGLIRMMVFGSAMALTGRYGLLHLDEAWTFLQAGREEIEQLGRLARSQQVLPLLYTQRVKDATDAGLAGYISRGLIMSIEDEAEAMEACKLFKLDPTPERMSRITARATRGGAPNWKSLKPLRDGEGGDVLRGSVCLYSDLSGERTVPVEVRIPDFFFAKASTNPLDIARKREAMQLAEAERARQQAS